jgi:YD repeat-containing protein
MGMKLLNRISIALVVFALPKLVVGQSPSPTDRRLFYPQVIQTSPETAMIQRFGNYQVNLFSGLPDISIPIYEINTGKLQVPIVLSYHASGVRVRDEASWVGLNWSLSAGGNISRIVKGSKADEFAGCLNQTYPLRDMNTLDPLNNIDDLNYLNMMARGYVDGEPDIFSFNLPTLNAKFYYANANTNNVTTPVFIPYTPVKLTTTLGLNSLSFNAKDESGIEYNLNTERESSLPGSGLNYVTASWKLSQMISPDKSDTIKFSYNDNSYTSIGGDYTETTSVTDLIQNALPNMCGSDGNCTSCNSTPYIEYGGGQSNSIGSKVNNEIVFPEGKIVFELDPTLRLDLSNKSLKSIKIYRLDPVSKGYSIIKIVNFSYGYFVNGTHQRLKLTGVQVMDKLNSNPQNYSFNYDETILMPNYSHRGRDYWGFYNGKPYNQSLIPNTVVPLGDGSISVTIGGNPNSRDADPAYNQVGILKKITFPTGGSSEFTYETNKYFDNASSTAKFAGGLRINQIKNFDPISNNYNYKTYKYGVSDVGYGEIILPLNRAYYSTEQFKYYSFSVITVSRRVRSYCSNANIGLESFDGAIVGYTEVKEINGTDVSNSGYSIYKYNFAQDQPDSWAAYGLNRPNILSRHFQRGQLIEKTDYKKLANATMQKIHTTVNTYGGAFPDDYNGAKTLVIFERNVFQYQQDGPAVPCKGVNFYQPYFFNTYSVLTGDNRITSNTETVYDDVDATKSTVSRTDYLYDNTNNKQVTRTRVTNSKNEIIETIMKYPHDYPANPVAAAMVSNNIINTVLDKEVKLGITSGVSLNAQHTEYGQPYTGKFYPAYITTKTMANTAETEINFDSYDTQGNLLQYTSKDAVKTAFIWDYNRRYAVAKVAGAQQSQIAYTSFESDGTGNWTIAGNSVIDATAPMGNYGYSPTASITKSGLPAANYIVSYWKKSGTATVSLGNGTPGRSINGWTYYEHVGAVAAGGTVTVSATGALLDELRLYPVTAVMQTYSFEPLVGMTGQCDGNNRISYYEFDESNRLKLVRDQDKNIIKQVCYSYAGQPIACNIYYNTARIGTFNKQGCTGCNVGSAYTYTVPANMYSGSSQAAADQLAQNDVNMNGQFEANRRGTCVAATAVPVTASGGNITYSFSVKFHNNCTSVDYQYTVNPNTMNVPLNGIPFGNYTVTMMSNGPGNTNYNYSINTFSRYGLTATITLDLSTTSNTVLIRP